MSDWKNVQYKDGKFKTGSGGGGTVTDVEVDGVSVVNQQGVAKIETPNAGGIEYDNQQSSLSATDVQSAIDELAQGGGGGLSISEDTLYVATSNNTGTYSLSASIDNYDFIAIWYGDWSERNQNINYMIMTVNDINELHNGNLNLSIVGYDNRYCFADIHNTTLLMKTISGHTIIKIRGIKYS